MTEPVKTRRLSPRWSAKTDDYVTSLAWSPDGKHLAVGNGAGVIDVFPAEGGEPEKIQAHDMGILCVTWNPAGSLLISAGQDGRHRSWNPDGSSADLNDRSHRGWATAAVWSASGSGVLAMACGKEVVLRDADAARLLRISDEKTTVEDLAWYPPGGMLLGAAYGGLRVWDEKTGEEIRRYDWPAALWSCTWSPDGRWVTAGSQEHSVHIWDAKSGDHMHMQGYPGKVRLQSWSADSRWLATAGGMDIILWDCSGTGPEGRQGKLFAAHADALAALAFHPHNNHLVSGCKGGRLILWNGDGEDEILGAAVMDQEISTLAWSPVQDRIAVGTAVGSVAVF